jgi:hypothetical protein
MDGIHDMGGMHGFGAIPIEDDEPVFHVPWEGRIFGINFVVESFVKGTNIDSGRYRIECTDPATYLRSSYYEKWTQALQSAIVEAGVCSLEEIEARMKKLRSEAG